MPQIRNPRLFERASQVLTSLFGPEATFRTGQYEAVEATLLNQRTLVVQRTGWGKSLVYFMATKLLREQGWGVTLVISPLISLMNNQRDAARAMGLVCAELNGSVDKELRPRILEGMQNGTLDLVFTTPETLFAADVQAALPAMSVGLFVIDEAHCISDWGHDFRLEYTRLRSVIAGLANVPLLATTATATDSVVEDICQQLGGNVFVSRGPLVRDSLSIQVVRATDATYKYAWLLANLNQMPGSGIVYCSTTHDCDRLAQFLEENGITARPYHSQRDAAERTETLRLFDANGIKVLAATTALGMGYDKDDIAFVIHFQIPSGIVAYYQQIGRAGRKLSRAYAILLYGDKTDLRIQEHFIQNAFPTEEEAIHVVELITQAPHGMRFMELLSQANMRRERLNKALDFLQNDGFVAKDGPVYRATPLSFVYNKEHYDAITARREAELQEMVDFAEGTQCYSQAVVQALGDDTAPACGCCANCLGTDVFDMRPVDDGLLARAREFIDRDHLSIAPRKRWPAKSLGAAMGDSSTIIRHPNQEGFCLTRMDWGYGEWVSHALEKGWRFDDALVDRAVQVLAPYIRLRGIEAVVPVPSSDRVVVADFAARLAARLGLPLVHALTKGPAQAQADQQNSFFQCANVQQAVSRVSGVTLPRSVLLVDDTVSSGWTLAVCGALLQNVPQCEFVYPFALAKVYA